MVIASNDSLMLRASSLRHASEMHNRLDAEQNHIDANPLCALRRSQRFAGLSERIETR